MLYIIPAKPRTGILRYLVLPFLFVEVLYLHPKNGVKYAWYWMRQSLLH